MCDAEWQFDRDAHRSEPEILVELPEEQICFTAIDATGRFLHCDVLFMMEQGDEHYIVYTDGSVTNDGETHVYASVYDPAGLVTFGDGEHCALSLEPITDGRAWELIEHALDLLSEQLAIDE